MAMGRSIAYHHQFSPPYMVIYVQCTIFRNIFSSMRMHDIMADERGEEIEVISDSESESEVKASVNRNL